MCILEIQRKRSLIRLAPLPRASLVEDEQDASRVRAGTWYRRAHSADPIWDWESGCATHHATVSSASTSAAKEYLSGVLGLPSRRSTWKLALILCDGLTVAGRAATRGRTVCQWDLECSPLGPRLSTTIVPSGSRMRRGHLMRGGHQEAIRGHQRAEHLMREAVSGHQGAIHSTNA